jgi:hypothetical protein
VKARDAAGRFRPGSSGNPAGRQRGVWDRAPGLHRFLRDFANGNLEAFAATLIQGLGDPRTVIGVLRALAELDERTARGALAYRARLFSTPNESSR